MPSPVFLWEGAYGGAEPPLRTHDGLPQGGVPSRCRKGRTESFAPTEILERS